MTQVNALSVLLLLLPALLVVYWRLCPPLTRPALLLLASCVAIGAYDPVLLLYFLLMSLVAFQGGRMLMLGEDRRKPLLLWILLVWLVGNLCFFKYTPVMTGLFPLGMSYISFRLIHYVVESYRRKVPEASFTEFALYILFFPTFLAGPVERFPAFHAQIRKPLALDADAVNYALLRIVKGLVKKFIIADNLARLMAVLMAPGSHEPLLVMLCVYGLSVRIFMDFSGYTDMALGVARLFGFCIIENFDRPFFQKNIAMFWRSWHISVYTWIRDYFFFPVFGTRPSRGVIYAGIVLTMMVFHAWHGISPNLLVLGAYHGIGLLVWYIFQDVKRSWQLPGPVLNPVVSGAMSVFMTFTFVSCGTVFLMLDLQSSLRVFARVFYVY